MKEIKSGASVGEVNQATPESFDSFEEAAAAAVEVLQKAKFSGFTLILSDSTDSVMFTNHVPLPEKGITEQDKENFNKSMAGLCYGMAGALVAVAPPEAAIRLLAEAFENTEGHDERIVFSLNHLADLIAAFGKKGHGPNCNCGHDHKGD